MSWGSTWRRRTTRWSCASTRNRRSSLKLPNGRALTEHSHDYKRHGTTTLFAAFEVATGKVRRRLGLAA